MNVLVLHSNNPAKSVYRKPWVDARINAILRQCDREHHKMKKYGRTNDFIHFKELKRNAQRELRRAYWSYIEGVVTGDEQGHNKHFWRYVKHKRSNRNSIPPPLKSNRLLHSEDKQKAEILNKQFQDAFSDGTEFTSEEFSRRCPMPGTYPEMPPIDITCKGVPKQLKLLKLLKPHKAPGPDGIKPLILRECAEELAPALAAIFRSSLKNGVVPNDWREANVAPIYKKGEKYRAVNYRPVSLTCVICKIMEHVITSNVMAHADRYKIIYPLQHGFRRGASCDTQLIEFVDDISENLDVGRQTDCIIMDFSKAFDKVNHSLLVHKLHHYGVRGNTLKWINSFLINRSQSVVVSGTKSSSIPVKSGVPQGSVLGPSLFLFYINDIPMQVTSTVRLFADDTIMYLSIRNSSDASKLQQDLDRLEAWEGRWLMHFHPEKCAVIHITKSRSPVLCQYHLHGHTLGSVNEAKYLGVTISKDLGWGPHVRQVAKKANRTLAFLRRNLNIHSAGIKALAYKSIVRPSMEYASAAWDPYRQVDIDALEMVQRRGARYVTHTYHRTASVTELMERLGWVQLNERRKQARLAMLYKIHKDKVLIDAATRLQPPRRVSRHADNATFQMPSCRTDLRKCSFYPQTIRDWNKLPEASRLADSLEVFKTSIGLLA